MMPTEELGVQVGARDCQGGVCNLWNLKAFKGSDPYHRDHIRNHAATTYRAVGIVGCGPPQILPS
jgi:hypothetical protein